MQPMKILHVLRSPVGGLFRHVADLARGQSALGHRVGIVADSSMGGAHAAETLSELHSQLALGCLRLPMSRNPSPRDMAALKLVRDRIRETGARVIPGHGSKGGLYARFAAPRSQDTIRVYTPHGGSLHYTRGIGGLVFGGAERLLERKTDLFLFESRFASERFTAGIVQSRKLIRIVHNGLHEFEFAPVAPGGNATDLLFIGELRMAKGIDTLIDALPAASRAMDRPLTLTLVGAGPDEQLLRGLVQARGLGGQIHFAGAMPARKAFPLGRVLVVPSRLESLPYIVLEAAAAELPLIATNVGGIPEIFGPDDWALIPPSDPAALAKAITSTVSPGPQQAALALRLKQRVRAQFSVTEMTNQILTAYSDALAAKRG